MQIKGVIVLFAGVPRIKKQFWFISRVRFFYALLIFLSVYVIILSNVPVSKEWCGVAFVINSWKGEFMEKIFIKTGKEFTSGYNDYAPAHLFRRRFVLNRVGKAELVVCGLGYGYYYLNGHAVSKDLLTAPVSDYDAILWYNRYDISPLLHVGENVFAAALGNGFFNESFPSNWDNNLARWRDHPKLFMVLFIDGEQVFASDENFVCQTDSFVPYNHLRSGETFDARKYHSAWKQLDYDDSLWEKVVIDQTPPKGELRECTCPPIIEVEELNFVKAYKTEKGYTLDFGRNIAGYIRLYTCIPKDKTITFRHAEEIYDDASLKLNGLNVLYSTVDFQTDRYISDGSLRTWSPRFTYHGFRYVSVEGLEKAPTTDEIKAIVVHQDVAQTSSFECSNLLLNNIYQAGIQATFSNMHYALTDCPTREKFGWMNDAQASLNQVFINFDSEQFLRKWGEDMKAAMNENGELPAIVPSHGYGFSHGPVADGAIFELAYRLYLYTGDKTVFQSYLPYLKKYYAFYISGKDDGKRWLRDWDGYVNRIGNIQFLYHCYLLKFARILSLACETLGEDSSAYRTDEKRAVEWLKANAIKDGKCVEDGQTAVAMLLVLGAFEQSQPLLEQLKERIDAENGHLQCGMLGIQFIYDALSMYGAPEYAYKVITAKGEPGFAVWFERGATTLWETWRDSGFTDSRNHHMYSNVLAWFFETLLGIRADIAHPAYERVELCPCFMQDLTYCKGSVRFAGGEIRAHWYRQGGGIIYEVNVVGLSQVYYNGQRLTEGKNVFVLQNEKTHENLPKMTI